MQWIVKTEHDLWSQDICLLLKSLKLDIQKAISAIKTWFDKHFYAKIITELLFYFFSARSSSLSWKPFLRNTLHFLRFLQGQTRDRLIIAKLSSIFLMWNFKIITWPILKRINTQKNYAPVWFPWVHFHEGMINKRLHMDSIRFKYIEKKYMEKYIEKITK